MKNNIFRIVIFFIVSFFVLSGSMVHSQEWVTANQSTITWDAVVGSISGTAFPESDIIEYKVYLSNAITDPDKDNLVEVGVTENTTYAVTLNVEGRFFVGLQTIRKSEEGNILAESIIGWSSDPTITTNGHTFGLQYFLLPAIPCGMQWIE